MTNAIAETVGRSPMSPNLVASLARAAEFATTRRTREVTVEHLLLAFVDDPDASIILGSSNIDLAKLTASIITHLDLIPPEAPRELSVSAELTRILAAAAAAAQQGRRSEINGAIVLAAIIGDGRTEAAQLLKLRGLTFDAAIRALQRAASLPPPASRGVELAPAAPPTAEPPTRSAGAVDDILASARERVMSRASSASTSTPPPPEPPTLSAETSDLDSLSWPEPAPGADDPEAFAAQTPEAQPRSAHSAPDAARPRPASAPADTPESDFARTSPARRWAFDAPPPAHPAPGFDLAGREPTGELGGTVGIEAAAIEVAVSRAPKTLRTTTVEARVPKASVRAFVASGRGRSEIDVPKALAARLRAREGECWIEMASAETVWIEATGGLETDDYANWRWTVTPRSRGRKRLQLVASARAVTGDGLVTQVALPDQTVDIRVRGDYARPFKRLAGWILAAVVGGLIATFGGPLVEAALPWIEKFLAR